MFRSGWCMPSIRPTGDPEDRAHTLATAEIAVRHVYSMVEATEKPVKVEIEIVQDAPTAALIRASASAPMICVGAVGLRHFSDGHLGSTAEALAGRARCPVAIVRQPPLGPSGEGGCVVAIVEDIAGSSAVLDLAVGEALLRHAPLRVLTVRPGRDVHAAGRLDRCLAQWRHRHPGLDIDAEVVRGRILDYLTRLAPHTRVVVVGPQDRPPARNCSARTVMRFWGIRGARYSSPTVIAHCDGSGIVSP